jgi:hypothetical protein
MLVLDTSSSGYLKALYYTLAYYDARDLNILKNPLLLHLEAIQPIQ